jgi:sugar (pentulose or hexulose) kinase
LEGLTGVNETVSLDEAVLLFALTRRAEAVVLTGGGLSNPACCSKTADVVERARQALHAALTLSLLHIRGMFALASSASRRICAGPSG